MLTNSQRNTFLQIVALDVKQWFPKPQHQHHLCYLLEIQNQDATPHGLSQKLWGQRRYPAAKFEQCPHWLYCMLTLETQWLHVGLTLAVLFDTRGSSATTEVSEPPKQPVSLCPVILGPKVCMQQQPQLLVTSAFFCLVHRILLTIDHLWSYHEPNSKWLSWDEQTFSESLFSFRGLKTTHCVCNEFTAELAWMGAKFLRVPLHLAWNIGESYLSPVMCGENASSGWQAFAASFTSTLLYCLVKWQVNACRVQFWPSSFARSPATHFKYRGTWEVWIQTLASPTNSHRKKNCCFHHPV